MDSRNRFIVYGSDKSIKIFDLQTKQQVHQIQDTGQGKFSTIITRHTKNYEGEILSMAVTPDMRFIVTASKDRSIKVFDLLAKHEVHQFPDATQSKFLRKRSYYKTI